MTTNPLSEFTTASRFCNSPFLISALIFSRIATLPGSTERTTPGAIPTKIRPLFPVAILSFRASTCPTEIFSFFPSKLQSPSTSNTCPSFISRSIPSIANRSKR